MSNADLAMKPCRREGCPHPRMINSKGQALSYCETHQREEWNKSARKQDDKRRANKGLPPPQHNVSTKPPAGTRECNRCNVRKPNTVDYFPPARRGLSMTCRACKPTNALPADANQLDAYLVDHNASRLLIVSMKIVEEADLPRESGERRLAINNLRRESLVLEYGKDAEPTPAPVVNLQTRSGACILALPVERLTDV